MNNNSMIRVAALSLALAIAGCSSVPLDNVPVENANATPTGPTQPPAQSRVEPVQTASDQNASQGPQNVARIIYFDFDSYVVKPEYQGAVDGHARYLRSNPARHIFIEGHTDERGGREYNLALGQRRAEAVRNSLRLLGVQDNQVEAVSFGKEKPADPANTEDAFAKNRRAEVVYR